MQARNVMSTPVISVGPETPVYEIATLLLDKRIGGVPVLEEGRLVGIVSETDLMHRHEIGTERDPDAGPGWLRLFRIGPSPARYVKSHATKAKDIMTRKVVSVGEDTPVAEVARLLDSRRLRRMPVLRTGKVVGIVSRGSLVRALATKAQSPRRGRPESDEAIRSALLAELKSQPWWRSDSSNVSVNDGIVRFRGVLASQDERDATRVAAENVPGVRGVEDSRVRYYDLPWSV